MPSVSPSQARLMAAVAHGWRKPGGGGPPRSVAKEFNRADKGSAMLSRAMAKRLRRRSSTGTPSAGIGGAGAAGGAG